MLDFKNRLYLSKWGAMLSQIEKSFNRALFDSIQRKKLFFTFPCACLCGLFFVFCQIVSKSSGKWIQMFFNFLPIFLAFGVLLAVGVVLIKVYYFETKKTEHSFKKIIYCSSQMLLNIAYLALPFILAYIATWIVLGIFYLLKSIPFLGEAFGSLFAFIPFLLVLIGILLTISTLFSLFFLAPEVTLKTGLKFSLIKQLVTKLKLSFFSDLAYVLIGIAPAWISFKILSLAAKLTYSLCFSGSTEVAFAFQSLFIMIPFCALMTPSVIFFFNFSTECYLMNEKE